MTLAISAVLALIAGLAIGYWMRSHAARTQVDGARAEKSLLEQSLAAKAAELASAKSELEEVRAQSGVRAGFESLAAERLSTIERLTVELNALKVSDKSLTASVSKLEAELSAERGKLAENLALLAEAKKTLSDQFEAVAGRIFDAKTKSFSEASLNDLKPLREQLENFRKRVDQVQTESTAGVTKLETLIGTLSNLNQQLTNEARHLTTALRGSAKAQGDWGEFILRDLLEKAGLREGEQYSFQQTFTNLATADGEKSKSARTDVLLHFPGSRDLVIDSKVSLTAYTDYANSDDEEIRKSALKAHLVSVRSHIAELNRAGYHRLPGVETPDFVVMFVPVEPAFMLALQSDAALWHDAYQQGILLVGPTTLLYIIRIVDLLWEQEKQARNVKDVMDRGAELYDKFVGFVSDMESIGESLRRTDASYSSAMKKLSEGRGNLVRQVEMLKQLGVRSTKALPPRLLDRAGAEDMLHALTAEAQDPDDHQS